MSQKNKDQANILNDIDNEMFDRFFDLTFDFLCKHSDDGLRKDAINRLKKDDIKKDKERMMALMFGVICKENSFKASFRSCIRKRRKFKHKKFFKHLDRAYDKYVLSHNKTNKLIDHINKIYAICIKDKPTTIDSPS